MHNILSKVWDSLGKNPYYNPTPKKVRDRLEFDDKIINTLKKVEFPNGWEQHLTFGNDNSFPRLRYKE